MAEAGVIGPIEELSDSASRPRGSSFSAGNGSKLSRSERKKNRSTARRTFENYPDRDLKHQKRRGLSPIIPRIVFSLGALGTGYTLAATGASGYETSSGVGKLLRDLIKNNKPVLKMAQFTSETFLPAFAHYAPLAILADAVLSVPVTLAKKAYARTEIKLLLRLGGVADEDFEKAVKMARHSSLSSDASIFSAKSRYGEVLHEFYVKMPDAFTKKLLHGTSSNFGALGFDLRKVPGGENLPDGEFSISAIYNAYKIIKAGYRGQQEEAQKLIDAIKSAGIDPKYYAFLEKFVPTPEFLVDFSKHFLNPEEQGGPFKDLIEVCIPDDVKRAAYLAELKRDAEKIKQNQDLIGLCEGQIIDLRRRLKNNIRGFTVYNRISAKALENYKSKENRGNVKAIGMTSEQIARLTAATAKHYADQVTSRISNSFVTREWCVGVLNAKKQFWHPILNRRLARQQELVRQICNLSGEPLSRRKFKKQFLKSGGKNIKEFIRINNANIEAVRAGVNAGNYSHRSKLREHYIVTDKFKLKRGSRRQILKHTDEYKKASLRKNAFPIISKALGKFFWTTVAAAFTAIAIASGAGIVPIVAGAALTAFGLTNKLVLEKKFGKFPYFTKKARAYRAMREQEKHNRYFANDTTYTSTRFRAKTLFNRRKSEFFTKYNRTVAAKSGTTSALLENVCEAYGVKKGSVLAQNLEQANKAYEMHVIANNANIQFTEHPIEVYITSRKGLRRQKVKLCFTSKDMLEKSLPGILLGAAEYNKPHIEVCCDGVKRDFYADQISAACGEIQKMKGVDNCHIISRLKIGLNSDNQEVVEATKKSALLSISSAITGLTENEDVQRQYNGVFSRVKIEEFAQTDENGIVTDYSHVIPRHASNGDGYYRNLASLRTIYDGKRQALKEDPGFEIDYENDSRSEVPDAEHIMEEGDDGILPAVVKSANPPTVTRSGDDLLDSPYDNPEEMAAVQRLMEINRLKEEIAKRDEEIKALREQSQSQIDALQQQIDDIKNGNNSGDSDDSDDTDGKPVAAKEDEDHDKKLQPVRQKAQYPLARRIVVQPDKKQEQQNPAGGDTYNITINGNVNGVLYIGDHGKIVKKDNTFKTFKLVVAANGMINTREQVGHPPIIVSSSRRDEANQTPQINSSACPLLLEAPKPKKQIDYIKLFTEKVVKRVMAAYQVDTRADFEKVLKSDRNFAKVVCNGIFDGNKSDETVISKIDFVETMKKITSYHFSVKARPSKSNAKRYRVYAAILDSMPDQIIAGIIQSTKLTPSIDGCDRDFGFGDFKKAIAILSKQGTAKK